MKNLVICFVPFFLSTLILTSSSGQNVGINCPTPIAKLHVRGSSDISQFIVDANNPQSNSKPLIKLRDAGGSDLMWINSDNPLNVFIGLNAGKVNNGVTGTSNTFVGTNTGTSNIGGYTNTAIGTNALYANIYGNQNTAMGHNALYLNTEGNANVAIGKNSLYFNTVGNNNSAIGNYTLYNCISGEYNTAAGTNALFNTTIGSKNTAYGVWALISNKAGSNATAIGCEAMSNANNQLEAFDNNNVAVGYQALKGSASPAANIGMNNTAIGYQALLVNSGGSGNTANGFNALNKNTVGQDNTAHGENALFNNTTGINNTAVGALAGHSNTTGNNNTAIGRTAFFTAPGLSNTACLGAGSGGIQNSSNRIEIGNSSVSWIGGQVTWATYSDGRIKDNVAANVPGLDFINRLRPVTYNLNIHRQNDMVYAGKKEVGEWPEKYDVEEMRITGFIAQEVAQAAAEAGYEFSGVEIPRDPNDLYSIRYSDFVMPLVKATQELSASHQALDLVIDQLRSEIEYQKSENVKLAEKLEKLEEMILR